MANMYDISPLSYHPTTNMDWFTKALFGGRLVNEGKITPIVGIKESTLLNMINITETVLQSDGRDCAWTPEQIFKLSEKELKIKTYKINLEQCIDDLERKRINVMLNPGAKNTELPASLEEATLEILATELSGEIETKIFRGNSSTDPNSFDGAVTVLSASTEAVKIVGTTLTKANIISEISKVYEAIPEAVLQKGLETNSIIIAVSHDALRKLRMALADVSNQVIATNFTLEGQVIRLLGIEVFPVKGLEASEMIAFDVANFILGTDLMSDLDNIRLGQFPAPNDSKIFIDGRLRLGFVIPFEDEVVFYSPNNTAPEGFAAPVSAPIVDTYDYKIVNPNEGKELGYDGVSAIVNGIDQTPATKLPKVSDLEAIIKDVSDIEGIRSILCEESFTIRKSTRVIESAKAKIKELEGGK